MLSSSIFIWCFLGASLVFCTTFLNQYAEGHEEIVQFVLGISLLASLATSTLMLVLARRFAVAGIARRMISGPYPVSGLTDSFNNLTRIMGVKADFEEAMVGNAFSLSFSGRNIVAISTDMAQSLLPEEAEAVLAHELSHIRNRDSFVKSLARIARVAFPFDPVIRLVEAAVHRDRELLADRVSIHFTEKPLALASALLKACNGPSSGFKGLGAALCIGGKRRGLFSLYPDLDERIDILIGLAKGLRGNVPSMASA